MDRDRLRDLTALQINGRVGGLLDACIQNGIMTPRYQKYAQAYTDKTDTQGSFCGEFWGKWFTSAAQACRYRPKEEYFSLLSDAVRRLLTAQEPDGRLSCSAEDFPCWDIWGRKYALLGLVAWYDLSGDKAALTAAARVLDNLIDCTRGKGIKLTETGLRALEAVSSCSILQPVVQIYDRTGEKRYLEYAEYLVGLWSEPSAYNPHGIRLLEEALAGTPPVDISCPKGYETMSCLEGVCELYRFTGKKRYLDAVLAYMEQVAEREVMITGSGSSMELWCEGRYRQTQVLEAPMETCVTATYMKLCHQLLRLTGDVRWADALEVSLFNALAGAMRADGAWWAYFSPLQGQRVLSQVQLAYVQSSCCVVNGPRALTEVPQWAMMAREDGFALNLYQSGEYAGRFAGEDFVLEQKTEYPKSGVVCLTVKQCPSAPFTLALRIPGFCRTAQVAFAGKEESAAPGWHEIHRAWQPGDTVTLTLNLHPRIVSAPRAEVYKALMVGPIVLGMDNRFVQTEPHESLWLMNDAMELVHDDQLQTDYYRVQGLRDESETPLLTPTQVPGTQMAFCVKFLKRPVHFLEHEAKELVFCDYASCGSDFAPDRSIRVWFSDPFYTDNLFDRDTRKVVSYFSSEDDAFLRPEKG